MSDPRQILWPEGRPPGTVIDQHAEADSFVGPHFTYSKTGDGFDFIVLSGVVILGFKGTGTDWRKSKFNVILSLEGPIRASGRTYHTTGIRLRHWAPHVAPNSIAGRTGANLGFAVDGFRLVEVDGVISRVNLEVSVAVRLPAAFLHRISYHVTLIGKFTEQGGTARPARGARVGEL
jgi:hypothetical protein